MKVSNCCGVVGTGYLKNNRLEVVTFEQAELCSECVEHCEYVEEEENEQDSNLEELRKSEIF